MLLQKRARLAQLGNEVRGRIEEVMAAKAVVERETVSDCEAILERLRAAESVKLATLSQSANEVDAEVEAIDRLVRQVDGAGGDGSTAMLGLIQGYPDLVRGLERLASRALPGLPTAEAGATLADFPRETKKRVYAMNREPRYEEALAVKDRMIWEVMQERIKAEKALAEEKTLCEEYSEEMGSWLEMTDRLGREVNVLREVAAQVREFIWPRRRPLPHIYQRTGPLSQHNP